MCYQMRIRSLLAVVGIVLTLTGLEGRPASQTTAVATVQDLQGVDELKTMFNRDFGKTRLVLLLSPT
jgi:hypothetical protein